jgi:MscS family membrane protein
MLLKRLAVLLSLCLLPLTASAAEAGDVSRHLPDFMQPLVDYSIFGFALWRLVVTLLLLIIAMAASAVSRFFLSRYALKEEREQAGLMNLMGKCFLFPLRLTVWAVALSLIAVVLGSEELGARLLQIFIGLSVALLVYNLVDIIEFYALRYAEKTETKLDDMLVPILKKSLRVLVIIVACLHLYNAITDQPITTLLAGLGLGGLAFALAAQDTLKNVFGFVMIVLDRPFVVGERIDFDGHDGVVESVGFRSTRLRRLDGHLVTVPNSRAADSVIHNIGRRPYIRRVMNVTITYDTPLAKVDTAVKILEDILRDHEGMNAEFPPRVYFSDFNADSLNLLVIYWYFPPDYWNFMAHAQRVNLELMRRFEEEGIEFAFPTQTVYLAGDEKRRVTLQHEGLPFASGLEQGEVAP